MAEEEMSLATGDSTFVKKDCPADQPTYERSDQESGKPVQTEVYDCPDESNVNDSVADNAEVEVELQTERCGLSNDADKKVTDDTDIEVELQTEICGHSNVADATDAVFEDSPLSKSVDFMYETKYVMLNFMSLIPPDMYRGHISTSPEAVGSEPEFHKKFIKSNLYLSKSKSFDTGLQNRKPHLKLLGKLKSMQKHLDSPASEDNVSYHYQNNWKKLDSPDSQRFNSDPCSPQGLTHLFEKSQSAHEFSSYSSPSHSPQKSIHSPQRQYSDVSSSGELSYMSDADDEYEEYSNASSIFSARSISSRDGFLDLRRSVHILPTLPSQSEDFVDDVDGNVLKPSDGNAQNLAESSCLATLPEEVKCDDRDEDDTDKVETFEGLQQAVFDGDGRRIVRKPADRSKLKLHIPREPVQLDDILLSLHTELSSEFDELESEYEEALQSAREKMTHAGRPTPLTPQSEAARVLARIGDEVKMQYGARLAAAVNRLTYQQITSLSYQQYRDIAQSVVSAEIPGWRQVALLMVFGQKIIWGAVQQGHRQTGNLFDYCSQLVAEVAADFIIKQGGWGSVMNFDPSSDTQSSGGFDTSPEMIVDYFASHDITQVESEKCFGDGEAQNGNKETCIDVAEQVGDPDTNGKLPNGEPNQAGIQTLSVEGQNESTGNQTKSRYASSVGFDYAEYADDLTEADIKTDSEENEIVAFVEPEVVNSDVDDTEPLHKEASGVKTDEESQDKAESNTHNFVMKASNDLNNTNSPSDAKPSDYNKGSIYVRQATPNTASFENTDHSNENVNTRTKPTNDHDIIERTNRANESEVTMIKSDVRKDVDDEVMNKVTVMEGSVNANDTTGNKNVNNKVANIPTLNNNAMAVKQPVNSGGSPENDEVMDVENVNNNNTYNEELSTGARGRDIPAKYDSDNVFGPNMNNNGNKSQEERSNGDNSVLDEQYWENESDVDKNEDKVTNRELMDESQIPAFIRRTGIKVAALALAVVVLGISVRLATLNR